MNMPIISQKTTKREQRFVLPGYYNWQQFKSIQNAIEDAPGLAISYVDGKIELMTIGEEHEIIKTIIGALIELYFLHYQIDFIPVGSATREAEEKGVSFEPDESYYIGEKKENLDLAVEVNITSGSLDKLAKYKRFGVKEVWLWENNHLYIYTLDGNNYQQQTESKILVNLDIDLFIKCVKKSSKLTAMNEFIQGLSTSK